MDIGELDRILDAIKGDTLDDNVLNDSLDKSAQKHLFHILNYTQSWPNHTLIVEWLANNNWAPKRVFESWGYFTDNDTIKQAYSTPLIEPCSDISDMSDDDEYDDDTEYYESESEDNNDVDDAAYESH